MKSQLEKLKINKAKMQNSSSVAEAGKERTPNIQTVLKTTSGIQTMIETGKNQTVIETGKRITIGTQTAVETGKRITTRISTVVEIGNKIAPGMETGI